MGRLLQAEARELAGTKLKVEYELVTTSLSEATAVQETLADPTKSAGFAAAFTTALVEKEAASGRAVTVKEIVPEAATVTSVTTVVTITPAPTAPPTPVPTPATPAPTPAEESSEEEESDNDNGALIGGVVGGV